MPSSASSGRTDGRAARWAGQRERRRREFVEAALRAIRERGPDVSTERIAEEAGVARTQLYKHFTDATDIHRTIALRAVELINAELAPLWQLHGSPAQMISTAVDTHIRWLAENRHLYQYLSRHSLSAPDGPTAVNDVRTTIGEHLTVVFEHYLAAFGLDTRIAEPAAFSVVGLVDASTAQWLRHPGGLEHAEFAAMLSRWVWRILDDALRDGGVEVDPDLPLALPELSFPSSRTETG
ncbi:TetR/AcrR family transcriptional regulator [Amycolatopsis lurida]